MKLSIKRPELGLELLGAPASWPPDLWQNIKILFQQYFNFIDPRSGVLMTPVLGLGSIALLLLGAWQLFTVRYTARSYTLTAWVVLLLPILLINPSFTSVTFVPLLLILASGLSYLLRSWYSIFPRNPYARFVGMVPLTILVAGLVVTGLGRYFDGYRYDPETAGNFSHDLSLLNTYVATRSSGTVVLQVTKSEEPFYHAVAMYYDSPSVIVTHNNPSNATDYIATRAAHRATPDETRISRIVTTDDSNASDRFYIYKND